MSPSLRLIPEFLFFSPGCRSVHRQQLQTCLMAALGTVQIMVGLFNIGLGPGRTSTYPGDFTSLGAAYWLGAVFTVTGIMSILAGQFPSSCLMGFTVFLNIVCAIFAITGIVLYVVDLRNASLLWICDRLPYGAGADRHDDSCRNVALYAQDLLTSMDNVLIILALLLLFVSVRFAVLGIRFLIGETLDDENYEEVEDEEQQLKGLLMISHDDQTTDT